MRASVASAGVRGFTCRHDSVYRPAAEQIPQSFVFVEKVSAGTEGPTGRNAASVRLREARDR